MGYKRTGLLLASSLPLLVSFVPLSLATTPQTPTPTWKAPPITDTQSLRQLAVQELENASLESNFPLQVAFSLEADGTSAARNICALILTFVGWLSNASLEAALHPLDLIQKIWGALKLLPFLYSTGILKDFAILLSMMCIHPETVKQTATIQAKFANYRRADCAIQEPILTEEMKRKLLADSKRYFNFSAAAYGISQMLASEVMQPPAIVYEDGITLTITQKIARKIADHLGISDNQILYLTPLDAPLSNSYHFVAIDTHTNSVVLAIRGTYSVSELCDDARACTVDFCGGKAHKGIADRALNLLRDKKTIEAIRNGLAMNSTYRLVLTGHSLGAGTASLMNLMLHVSESHRDAYSAAGRDIRCFGFGCPPVFVSTEGIATATLVEQALTNTVCFINSEDVIPHMSFDAIRRLAELLERVHGALGKPLQDLEEIVKNAAADLKPIPNAERLRIPGNFVVWMSKPDKATKSDVILCEPSKVSNLGFRLMGNLAFMNDHLPTQYEKGFKDLAD